MQRKIYLAKSMDPNRESFEKLGFVFDDSTEGILCNAKLPEGWSLKERKDHIFTDVFDEIGRKRATMFYKADWYEQEALMFLLPRYKICTKYYDELTENGEIYFGNEDEVLYIAGVFHDTKDVLTSFYKKRNLELLAEEFANNNYPEWKDPLAYWDNNMSKVL